jgi:curved DNA-binding protein CbpA
MTNKRNLYRVLHVQHDAPYEIIRSSYRTLMQTMKAHPDLGGDAQTANLINHAYEVLSNPYKRFAYNQTLVNQRHPVLHYLKRLTTKPATQAWNKFVPPKFD